LSRWQWQYVIENNREKEEGKASKAKRLTKQMHGAEKKNSVYVGVGKIINKRREGKRISPFLNDVVTHEIKLKESNCFFLSLVILNRRRTE